MYLFERFTFKCIQNSSYNILYSPLMDLQLKKTVYTVINFVRSLNPCRQWQSSYINTHYFTLGFPAFQMGLDQAKQQGTLSVQMAISLYSSVKSINF